jgi:DNA polymerase-3 subunit delta
MARSGPLDFTKPAPVYVFHGPERLLVDRAVAALRDATVKPALRAFNYDVFDAGEKLDSRALVQAARTLPMMGGRRLVHVKGAHDLSAAQLEVLLPYLADPAPETVLLLVADKLDTRLKFFAQAKKVGVVEKFEPPYENRLPGFVEDEARQQGLKLERGAAQRLADVVGRDLGRLCSSLEQLGLYAAGRAIKAEDVDELVADSRERNVFELCDATYAGNRPRALRAARNMLANRESAIGMVAMLARHARQLIRIRALGPRPSPGEVASALGLSPYFAGPLTEQARRYSDGALERALLELAAADRNLKGQGLGVAKAGLGDELLVERLLGTLLSLGAQRPRA